VPAHPFEFTFLDQAIEDTYRQEKTFGRLINYATILAIFVACLGLFGLTSFAVQRRTKEIGIRKTLGATVPRIVLLFTLDFIKLIAIANVIAWPIGYFLMRGWLQSYAYRTSVGWFTLIFAGLFTLAIAVITISFQAIKAALSNPIHSLRYE
jgi:putative ABC transport system permease protein